MVEPEKCPRCVRGKMVKDAEDGDYCLNCGYVVQRVVLAGQVNIGSSEELGKAAIAKAREIARRLQRIDEEREAQKAEQARFLRIAALCEVDIPPDLAPAKAKPKAAASDGERWTCGNCGWQAAGRYPGRHPQSCPKRIAQAAS